MNLPTPLEWQALRAPDHLGRRRRALQSKLGQYIIKRAGDQVTGGRFTYLQCLEVSPAAFDLGALRVSQVLREETTLGFDNEVKPLGAFKLD